MTTDKKIIKILLADDQAVVRAGLKGLLQIEDDFEITGEAKNIQEVKDRLATRPDTDVLILDLKWHENSNAGIEAITEIRAKQAPTSNLRIIVITNYSDLLADAEKAGADIALSKNFSPDMLIETVRNTVKNPANITRFRIDPKTDILTPKEKKILQLMQRGFPDKAIAFELGGLSEQTIKNHNKNIFSKLNVTNRQEAVTRGLLQGIIELQDTATHS